MSLSKLHRQSKFCFKNKKSRYYKILVYLNITNMQTCQDKTQLFLVGPFNVRKISVPDSSNNGVQYDMKLMECRVRNESESVPFWEQYIPQLDEEEPMDVDEPISQEAEEQMVEEQMVEEQVVEEQNSKEDILTNEECNSLRLDEQSLQCNNIQNSLSALLWKLYAPRLEKPKGDGELMNQSEETNNKHPVNSVPGPLQDILLQKYNNRVITRSQINSNVRMLYNMQDTKLQQNPSSYGDDVSKGDSSVFFNALKIERTASIQSIGVDIDDSESVVADEEDNENPGENENRKYFDCPYIDPDSDELTEEQILEIIRAMESEK